MAYPDDILRYHDECLVYLLNFRERYPGFQFWLRRGSDRAPAESKLAQGFWFQGTDYIFISPYAKGDANNKTQSIGFVLDFDKRGTPLCRLEIVWGSQNNDRPELDKFYEQISNLLSLDYPVKTRRTRRTKEYKHPEPLRNLEEFLVNDKPRIDRLISEYNLDKDFFIREDEFLQSLEVVLHLRELLAASKTKTEKKKSNKQTKQEQKQQTSSVKYEKITFSFESKFHTDTGFEDKLDHKLYATAIAEIIKDEKTKPPVNIAIIAPWGHGKTTLMQFIREQFEKREDWEPKKSKGFFATTKKLLDRLTLFAQSSGSDKDPIHTVIQTKPKKYPTIWFNPWKYQSSQQIWAGLGHAIITQLVNKYSPEERELIWLRLKAKRIDSNAIRNQIHKKVFGAIWPFLIGGPVLGLLVLLAMEYFNKEQLSLGISATITGLGTPICAWFIKRFQEINKTVEGNLADFVKEPDYTGNLGLYHEISEDLNIVCQELIDPQNPAIIFIDDLDRCSPQTVAEVFEAINLMITGDLKDRCYFVLGMDAQIVAASLDNQYRDWAGRLPNHEKLHGSVGWYFLDKFIQLPFFVPVLNPKSKKVFLADLFGGKLKPEATNQSQTSVKDEKYVQEKAKVLIEKFNNKEFTPELENEDDKTIQRVKEEMIRQTIETSSDSPEIEALINKFSDYLDSSPRGMKRFVNLLRFYDSQTKVRKMFPSSTGRADIINSEALAKWLVINIRWPQMVRWLQWEREEILVFTNDPEIKAKEIDTLITSIDGEKDHYKRWCAVLKKRDIDEKCDLKWLFDRDLFNLLHQNNYEEATLEMALKCDVW